MAAPTIHRRELIKLLGASGVALSTAAFFQSKWIKPVVKVGVLPAHAQASEEPPPITSPVTFNSGENLSWTVPAGVTSLRITALGAQGGEAPGYGVGGLGGRVEAELVVVPGETLSITVGGRGQDLLTSGSTGGVGGVGGGGNGGSDGAGGGAGGGGASWVLRGSTPLVVAGGGGGSSYTNSSGGAGGGDTGGSGTPSEVGGSGGQTGGIGGAGGGFDTGSGSPGTSTTGGNGDDGSFTGGGGGGGYGGGGGGGSTVLGGGGGGGASYVISGATVTVNTQGVNSGDGQIIFAWG